MCVCCVMTICTTTTKTSASDVFHIRTIFIQPGLLKTGMSEPSVLLKTRAKRKMELQLCPSLAGLTSKWAAMVAVDVYNFNVLYILCRKCCLFNGLSSCVYVNLFPSICLIIRSNFELNG